jgi:putative transposase
LILKTFKYCLYPNKEQKLQLEKNFGCCRFVYNYYLDKRIKSHKENKQFISRFDCSRDLTNLSKRDEFLWLQEIDICSLHQSIANLDKAYRNFFRKIKSKSEKPGFPKFKSKHNSRQSYITNAKGSNIRIENNAIKLPKLGFVKFDNHRPCEGKIKNATVSKTSNEKYFVSILVEIKVEQLPRVEKEIGIDLGLKVFATCSDNVVFENPKYFQKSEKRLSFLQRELSRKKKGSNRRQKAKLKVAKCHEKI